MAKKKATADKEAVADAPTPQETDTEILAVGDELKESDVEPLQKDPLSITAKVIQQVITGDPVEILYEYPLDDREDDPAWFMQQPDDWLYDMAMAVQDATYARVINQPEIKAAKDLPPSVRWQARQQLRRKNTEELVERLEKKQKAGEILPDEELTLEEHKNSLLWMPTAENMSLAKEKATDLSTKARDIYLMRHLITDRNGKQIFPPDQKIGDKRWDAIGREMREDLRLYAWKVLHFVQAAKN